MRTLALLERSETAAGRYRLNLEERFPLQTTRSTQPAVSGMYRLLQHLTIMLFLSRAIPHKIVLYITAGVANDPVQEHFVENFDKHFHENCDEHFHENFDERVVEQRCSSASADPPPNANILLSLATHLRPAMSLHTPANGAHACIMCRPNHKPNSIGWGTCGEGAYLGAALLEAMAYFMGLLTTTLGKRCSGGSFAFFSTVEPRSRTNSGRMRR